MLKNLDIKPCIGLSNVQFGATMTEVEKILGKPEEIELLDDMDDCESTVWHYWELGFSLFFDENNNKVFGCVEIDNEETVLWGKKIFSMTEKEIIALFKSKHYTNHETEMHEWGEKRLSFDDANIDFYFEKNKLTSINYGKPVTTNSPVLILPN